MKKMVKKLLEGPVRLPSKYSKLTKEVRLGIRGGTIDFGQDGGIKLTPNKHAKLK